MNSLFISLDLGTNSSGNLVSKHELEFLKSNDNIDNVIQNIIQLEYKDISPLVYNLPDNPFLVDYLTMNKVSQLDLSKVELCHLYAGPFTNTIRYLKAKGIKTFLSIDAHDRMESIKEFENLGYEYPFSHIKDDKLWKIYNGATKEADIVITPSKMSAEFLKDEGVEDNRIRVIPHGTNIPDTKDNQPIGELSKGLKTEFTVGYLGSYGPDKGVRYLIEAWSSLNYKDSELLLGGAYANKGLEPFIKKYAKDTISRFNLLGWIENIHTFYNLCSIYAQPSITEAWGMEVLEAMAHGRPVIVSEGCGAKDYVENGETGFIVNKRDPKAIADKIDWFKNHNQELYIMSGRCKQVAKNYSWDKLRSRYIDVWNSI